MSSGMGMIESALTAAFSARPPHPGEAITRSPTLMPLTPGPDRADDACDLGPGREGERRLELIHVLDHQDVGEVDRAGMHVDDDLAVAGHRIVDLLEHQ